MDEELTDPQDTRTRDLAHADSKFAAIANARLFKDVMLAVILVNAVWIGVEVDWREGDNETVFDVMESVFAAIFVTEIAVRLLGYRKLKYFATDEIYGLWNLFDSVLVLLMVLEVWLLPLFAVNSNIKALSTLRMFRLVRITRLFRMVPELAMIINAIGASFRSVTSSFAMFISVAYVFGIVLTQFAKDPHAGRMDKQISSMAPFQDVWSEFFGSVLQSMVTLLQIAVYDNAFALIRVVLQESVVMGAVLLLFLTGGAFMILNILIGVIREIVSETTQQGKQEILVERIDKFIRTENVDQTYYDAILAPKLAKLKIDENIIANVFAQTLTLQAAGEQTVKKTAFLAQLVKLLHPPETQDMLLAMKNLETFRHKLVARCNSLPVEVPRIVQDKLLSAVSLRAPDIYSRLSKRLQDQASPPPKAAEADTAHDITGNETNN